MVGAPVVGESRQLWPRDAARNAGRRVRALSSHARSGATIPPGFEGMNALARSRPSGPTFTRCWRCPTARSPTTGSPRTISLPRVGLPMKALAPTSAAWRLTRPRCPTGTSSPMRTCTCASSGNRSRSSPRESPRQLLRERPAHERRRRPLSGVVADLLSSQAVYFGTLVRYLVRTYGIEAFLRYDEQSLRRARSGAVRRELSELLVYHGLTPCGRPSTRFLRTASPKGDEDSVPVRCRRSIPNGTVTTIRRGHLTGLCPSGGRRSRSPPALARASWSRIAPAFVPRCPAGESWRGSTVMSRATCSLPRDPRPWIPTWPIPARRVAYPFSPCTAQQARWHRRLPILRTPQRFRQSGVKLFRGADRGLPEICAGCGFDQGSCQPLGQLRRQSWVHSMKVTLFHSSMSPRTSCRTPSNPSVNTRGTGYLRTV